MRVIVADDEELVRYSVRDMLKESSVPVTVVGEAENGARLVELCRALRPDLAFVDVRMPKMTGSIGGKIRSAPSSRPGLTPASRMVLPVPSPTVPIQSVRRAGTLMLPPPPSQAAADAAARSGQIAH